ncbi:MAG: hypothetical protein WC859_06130 [Elusimicrobiota bacterium]
MPGLAVFLTLLSLFFALIVYARKTLMQARLAMAAEATALSAARAQAEMLNKFSSYNDGLNLIVFPKYKNYAAPQIAAKNSLITGSYVQYYRQLPQFNSFPKKVGRWVAKQNGCDQPARTLPVMSHLQLQDLEVIWLDKYIPVNLKPETVEHVYYARLWGVGKRKAQPPHQTHWMVSKNGQKATASARVYLDAACRGSLCNGGFPSVDDQKWWEDAQLQSFFPQFNGLLLEKTPLYVKKLLALS